eukprot:CAMPEP_0179138990 /NCGR_PEP_ID=MMETSP0796-20121207/66425_1 /TAXON_ID=73915 /ORGANISM="Pyrodinium bahamense, Strain pbaha01" /LENGTH=54 /DNA_ID=CAMNT_0020838339 /DNA_START=442 /DNA_END=602 /DNA_ORIENTATION=-
MARAAGNLTHLRRSWSGKITGTLPGSGAGSGDIARTLPGGGSIAGTLPCGGNTS